MRMSTGDYLIGDTNNCNKVTSLDTKGPIVTVMFSYDSTNAATTYTSSQWYYMSCSVVFNQLTSSYDYDANNGYEQYTLASTLEYSYTTTCGSNPSVEDRDYATQGGLPSYADFDSNTMIFRIRNKDPQYDGTSVVAQIKVKLGDIEEIHLMTINILNPCLTTTLNVSPHDNIQLTWNIANQPLTYTWPATATFQIGLNLNMPSEFDNDYCGIAILFGISGNSIDEPFTMNSVSPSAMTMSTATYLDEGVYNYQHFAYLVDYPSTTSDPKDLQITVTVPCYNLAFDENTTFNDVNWPMSSSQNILNLNLHTTTEQNTCIVDYTATVTPSTIQSVAEVFSFTATLPQTFDLLYQCSSVDCIGTYQVTVTGTSRHDPNISISRQFRIIVACQTLTFTLDSAAILPDILYAQLDPLSYAPTFDFTAYPDCGESVVLSYTTSSPDNIFLIDGTEIIFDENTVDFLIQVNNSNYYNKSINVLLRATLPTTGLYVETQFKIVFDDPCKYTSFQTNQPDITIDQTDFGTTVYSDSLNFQTQLEFDYSLAPLSCGNIEIIAVSSGQDITAFSSYLGYDESLQKFWVTVSDPTITSHTQVFDVTMRLASFNDVSQSFQVTYNIVRCQVTMAIAQSIQPDVIYILFTDSNLQIGHKVSWTQSPNCGYSAVTDWELSNGQNLPSFITKQSDYLVVDTIDMNDVMTYTIHQTVTYPDDPYAFSTYQSFTLYVSNQCQSVTLNAQPLQPMLTILGQKDTVLLQFEEFTSSGSIDVNDCGQQTFQVVNSDGSEAPDFIIYEQIQGLHFISIDPAKITLQSGIYEYNIKVNLIQTPGFQWLQSFQIVVMELKEAQQVLDRISYVGSPDQFQFKPWILSPADFCDINYQAVELPSFMDFNPTTFSFTINAQISDVGNYTLQLMATLDDCFDQSDFSMLSQSWLISIINQTDPYQVGINMPPYFIEPLLEQEAIVGEQWAYNLPESVDPDQDAVSFIVNLGAAEQFMKFDSELQQFSVEIGATTEEQVDSYLILIALKDSRDNESEYKGFIFQLMTALNETNSTDSDEIEWEQPVFEWDFDEEEDKEVWEPNKFINSTNLPKVQFRKINSFGEIELKFSREMLIPNNISVYQSEFLDIEDNLIKPILGVNVIPGLDSSPSDLNFTWKVQSYEENIMLLQLYFENAYAVSQYVDPDQIEISFNLQQGFIDKQKQPVKKERKLIRVLPQQMQLNNATAIYKEALQTVGDSTKGVLIGNFITNLFLSASLNQLLSMINTQQIIIMMPLLKLVQPANSMIFFNILMQIAAFDIIPTDDWFYPLFDLENLDEDEPLTVNFMSLGFETIWFIINLGSVAIFLSIFPLVLFLILVFSICRSTECGKKSINYLKSKVFWNPTITTIIESYAILCLCSFINLKVLGWYSVPVIIQSVLAIVFALFCLVIPFILACKFYKIFDKADTDEVRNRVGALYEGLDIQSKDNGRYVILYPFFFLIRRLLLSSIVVFMMDYLMIQMLIVFLQSIFIVMIVGYAKPFISKRDTNTEYFNECIIIITMYHFLCFTEMVPSQEVKQVIGYLLVLTICIHILLNLGLIFVNNVCEIRLKIRKWLHMRRWAKVNAKKIMAQERNKRIERKRRSAILVTTNYEKNNIHRSPQILSTKDYIKEYIESDSDKKLMKSVGISLQDDSNQLQKSKRLSKIEQNLLDDILELESMESSVSDNSSIVENTQNRKPPQQNIINDELIKLEQDNSQIVSPKREKASFLDTMKPNRSTSQNTHIVLKPTDSMKQPEENLIISPKQSKNFKLQSLKKRGSRKKHEAQLITNQKQQRTPSSILASSSVIVPSKQHKQPKLEDCLQVTKKRSSSLESAEKRKSKANTRAAETFLNPIIQESQRPSISIKQSHKSNQQTINAPQSQQTKESAKQEDKFASSNPYRKRSSSLLPIQRRLANAQKAANEIIQGKKFPVKKKSSDQVLPSQTNNQLLRKPTPGQFQLSSISTQQGPSVLSNFSDTRKHSKYYHKRLINNKQCSY